MKIIPIKRALLSVSNKTGIVEFARHLFEMGVEVISTGGTSQLLQQSGIPHLPVEAVTGLPEMLEGRVKTLHPKIHGGILGKRDRHAQEANQHQIDWIDLVVVNFYPFADIQQNQQLSWDEAIEYVDIGGPTMVRAAAKNFAWVGVVVDPADYASVITQLQEQQGLTFELRKQFAAKAFGVTAQYDAMIEQYFLQKDNASVVHPAHLILHFDKMTALRYGENPHQAACAYQSKNDKNGVLNAKQYQGKALSYNNILDAEAAFTCAREFAEPACVIVKHANPCGVATAAQIETAFAEAYHADALSAFGGVIALNRACTKEIAEVIATLFMEVILAPAYTAEALAIFATKPNLRVLELGLDEPAIWEMKFITGGLLLQEKDPQILTAADLQLVTNTEPKQAELEAMLFAWRVLKHVKSNGILIAKNQMTVGIGAGQVSRIDAVDLAVRKAGVKIQDTILASDAFFPFRDSIDRIARTGVRAVIQPGGSIRDEEVIAACNEHNIAMVFTGKRCFRH